jgi:isoaspartyl peptidase/L-asparaginase-like protein (Ntn-hydrolase superfamily)
LKFRKWIDINEELLAKCTSYDQRTYQAEMYSALVNPVLEAEYALDEDTPLSLYDCVAVKMRRTNKYMSPYDAFTNEEIMNWRAVAAENDELREVVDNYKKT